VSNANQLEKVLRANIGKYVGIHYVLPDGTTDWVYGTLKEVTDDYIKVNTVGFGKSTHFINRKPAQILEFITKCEE